MFKKAMFYSFFSVWGMIIFMGSGVSAEIDEEGYEYTLAKASEIDFAKEDIFVALYEGDPTDEDALYAVYTDEELEKRKEDKAMEDENINPSLRAIKSKGFSSYYKSSKWINRSGVVSLSIQPKMNAWTGSSYAGNIFKQKDRWDVLRSEERRVGKECRTRRWTEDENRSKKEV